MGKFYSQLWQALIALSLLLPFSSHSLAVGSPDWDAGANPTPLLDSATFRWWAPDEKKLRAVLVFLPGRNGDARGMINESEWQELAKKERIALIGCRFYKQSTNSYQSDPDGKVTALIAKAIHTLASSNGHAYLKDPPIAFWGTSAGSNLAERFTSQRSKQVIAIASIKGTWGPREYSPEKGEIPWLFCVGKQDKPEWTQASLKYINDGLSKKAFWTLALHPIEGHGIGKSKALAIEFLTSAIELRLGSKESSKIILQKISLNNSWLGNPSSFEIQSREKYFGDKSDAIWLPNEKTARIWQAYLKPLPAPAKKTEGDAAEISTPSMTPLVTPESSHQPTTTPSQAENKPATEESPADVTTEGEDESPLPPSQAPEQNTPPAASPQNESSPNAAPPPPPQEESAT